jgi:DNA-binding transcriptional LysR family regulator
MSAFFLRTLGRLPTEIIEMTSLHGAIALVAGSDMVGALPRAVFALEHIANRLSIIDVVEDLPATAYAIVRRADAPLSPAALLLSDLLHSHASSLENTASGNGDHVEISPDGADIRPGINRI